MLAHYEANRGSGRTFCEVVESSSLVIEINLVLVRLERLGIAIPDRSRFSDEDEAGKMWWIAYLTALERLSVGGNIKAARATQLQELIRQHVGVEDGEGESNDSS